MFYGGGICLNIGTFLPFIQEEVNASILCYLAVQLGVSFLQVIIWTLLPFIVQVLLKYLKEESIKQDEELVEKCKKCLQLFEKLTLSFSNFFVIYFTLIQCYSIFMTFLFLRAFPIIITFTLQGFLLLFGFVTSLISNLIWLSTLTNSVDKTNECIKALGKEIQEKLLLTEDKQERRYLKFFKQRIDDLKPMNGSGYFTIDKTTLTSMLSVR